MITQIQFKNEYLIMHVVEAFGAGVGYSIDQIYTSYAEDIRGVVVHGSRDFNDVLKNKSPKNIVFESWVVSREINLMDDIKSLISLIGILRKYNPTLIHAHSSKAGVLARIAARCMGIPCIYTPHSYAFLRDDVGAMKRFIYKFCERALAPLATTVACGLEEFSLASNFSKNCTVVENGVNFQFFSYKLKINNNNNNNKKFRFICVGRIAPQKDFDFFEKIAENFSNKNIEFLWVTGEPIDDYEIGSNIKILGSRTTLELVSLYHHSDAYISTSRWEGLSRAALEAAACGLPLLLRSCPGNRELLIRMQDSIGFSTLSEAIIGVDNLLSKCGGDKEYGKSNFLTARRFYSSDVVQSRIRSIYDAIAFKYIVMK